ncbi:MAG TPA: MotA/TolQ/ExbB proton channel family protein [Kiritimatiellia bacterium]|nr:MotA/TolQ/ExbB proton channel family protein [Kiritimatiellia bacterium]
MSNDPDAAEVEFASEVESVQSGRPSTDANVFIQLTVGIVGTVVLSVGLAQGVKFMGGLSYLNALVNDRGVVQYGELLMAFMVVGLMFLKFRIVKSQLQVLASNPIPLDIDMSDDEQLQNLRDSLVRREEFGYSIILNRIDRAIALWLSTKDVGRVSNWARDESSRDTSSSDSSYSLCRVLIWAIPILGFIGTVMGLAQAVSGFGVMGESADISAIQEAIGQVTVGLGMAFDTTLLALILTVLLMFPLSFIQRNEENLFVEMENYLDDMFMARLPSPEQQPIVIENLEDSIEAAFRRYIPDPDRYDEVFTRSIENAASAIEERFNNLSKNYEATLRDVTNQLASNISGIGGTLEGSLKSAVTELSKQDEVMIEHRKQLSDAEAKQFQALLSGLESSVSNVAGEYKKVASELIACSEGSMTKSQEAARELAAKMTEVSKLAAGIQDLLKVEQAVEASLSGLSAADAFRKTMDELRNHLNVTSDFCTRMSKPKVITLTEEVVS